MADFENSTDNELTSGSISSSESFLKLTKRQNEIYNGLNSIGKTPASFYLDGVRMYNSKGQYHTRTHLLAHIARELESSIRQSFEGNMPKTKDGKGHEVSIYNVLGLDPVKNEDNPLAKSWIELVGKENNQGKGFSGYAHKKDILKGMRGDTEFDDVWLNFESLLHRLVGHRLNILERVDTIIRIDEPNQYALNTLRTLLQDKIARNYFFSELNKPSWFIPLYEEKYFSPSLQPEPISSDTPGYVSFPPWTELRFVERITDQLSQDSGLVTKLLTLIDEIIVHGLSEDSRATNEWNHATVLRILIKLPVAEICRRHIEFVKTILVQHSRGWHVPHEAGNLLLLLIEAEKKELVLELLDIFISFKSVDGSEDSEYRNFTVIPTAIAKVDPEHLKPVLYQCGEALFKLASFEISQKLSAKISEIEECQPDAFHVLHIPAIEEHHQNHDHGENKIKYLLVRLLRDALDYLEESQLRDTVQKLLGSELAILRRIGIHTVNKYYSKLNDLYWRMERNPFLTIGLGHETFMLHQEHKDEINNNKETLKIFLGWVEESNPYAGEEEITACHRKGLLLPLQDIDDKDYQLLFTKYDTIYSGVDYIPQGMSSWFKTMHGQDPEKTRLFAETLLSHKSNNELVSFLNNNTIEDIFESESKSSTGRALELALKTEPEKLLSDWKPFLDISKRYYRDFVRGLTQIQNSEDYYIPETNAFNILRSFVGRLSPEDKVYAEEFIWELTEYFSKFRKRPGAVFTYSILEDLEAIYAVLLPIADQMRNQNSDDWITDSLNTPLGKLYASMMDFCGKAYELQTSEKREPWISFIKDELTNRLIASQENSMNLYIVLGDWLSFIYTEDRLWVESNIDRLLPKDNPQVWQATMAGYLFNNGLTKNIYEYLTKEGHYQMALATPLQQGSVIESFVWHIYLAYVYDLDIIDDSGSNINILIKSGNERYLKVLFNIIYRTHDRIKYEQKLMPLWKMIVNEYRYNTNWRGANKLFGETSSFILGLKPEYITVEALELFSLALPYVEMNGLVNLFPDWLNKISEMEPIVAGEILTIMTNNGILYMHYNNEVMATVSAMYDSNDIVCKTKADEVCILYSDNGYLFLKDLYRKHNPGI